MIELMKLQGDSYMDITIGIVGIIPYAYPLDASEIYVRVRLCMSVYVRMPIDHSRMPAYRIICAYVLHWMTWRTHMRMMGS